MLMAICLCFNACSNESNDVDDALEVDTTPVVTEEPKAVKSVAESYPVVVLDNEYVKITVDGKFTDGGNFMDFGYNLLIENKCDKHIMVVPTNCSVDGFMLSLGDTPYVDTYKIAPNMKAKTYMFYMNADNNTTVKSVEDLVKFDGQWQLAFSDDGGTWDNFQHFDFEYILP